MKEKRSASDLKLKKHDFVRGPRKNVSSVKQCQRFSNDENTGDECSDDMLEGIIYPLLV